MRPIVLDYGMVEFLGMELPVRVHAYGLMLVLGVVAGIVLAMWRARRMGEDAAAMPLAGLLGLAGGLIGARAAFVIENYAAFAQAPRPLEAMLDVTSGGMIYYGGVIGGLLPAMGFLAVRRLPLRRYMDIVSVSILVGLAFGRGGCLLNGCCWGGATHEHAPAAMHYPMYPRPLLAPGDGQGFPQATRATHPFVHQYLRGQVRPDERLLNAFVTVAAATEGGGSIEVARLLPPGELHAGLEVDQLEGLFRDAQTQAELFAAAADAEGTLGRDAWRRELTGAGGLLNGSEKWSEAIAFDSDDDGRLSLAEFAAYQRARREALVARFGVGGEWSQAGRAQAQAWLSADLLAVADATRSNPVRPSQPLAILNALLLAGVLAVFHRHRRFEGQVFVLLLILYPITRFILESIRADDPRAVFHGVLTHNQWIGVGLVGVGIVLWAWFARLNPSCGPTLHERKATQPSLSEPIPTN